MSEGPGPVSISGAPATTYRCFLFADLRGYTSYIERSGNTAGADLVKDYLSITRTAVERFHGAEIKVEGDGFHAVFPSASSAVMCGLAIVDAAREATEARPDRPIRVGVGIHAGEAVETPEGFIGSAVNMASRVCAAASPGEVLVTGTVRGIIQASIEVGFASRGKQRLKGMNEPVELFAVNRGLSVGGGRKLGRGALAAIGLGAVAILAIAVLALALPGLTAPTPTATPVPTPAPLAVGPLQLGTYTADQFHPPFSFTIDDPGWSVYRIYPDGLGLQYGDGPEGRLDVANIPLLFGDACGGEAEVTTGTNVNDLVAAIQSVWFLHPSEVTAAEIDGTFAQSMDITVDPGAQAACGGFGDEGVAIFPVAEDFWRAQTEEQFRLQAVDVDATTVSFIMSGETAPDQSVPALEQFYERAERVVQSVDF